MRAAATPEMTVALQEASEHYDVSEMLGAIRAPTLVLNRWGDPFVAPEEARRLAGRIPGARLEMVDGEAHPYTVGDVTALAERITSFTSGADGGRQSAHLSAREAQVLQLVAEGCTNAQAADRLVLSVRTVERHFLNTYANWESAGGPKRSPIGAGASPDRAVRPPGGRRSLATRRPCGYRHAVHSF